RVVVALELRRAVEPLVERDRHLRRVRVKSTAAKQRRPAAALRDRGQVDAQRPALARSELDGEARAILRDTAVAAERQHGPAPPALALAPERDRSRRRLLPVAP